MQLQTAASSSKNCLSKFGWIWANLVGFGQNLGKIEAKFGQKWLDLGKIKILRHKNIRSPTDALNNWLHRTIHCKMTHNCENDLFPPRFLSGTNCRWKYRLQYVCATPHGIGHAIKVSIFEVFLLLLYKTCSCDLVTVLYLHRKWKFTAMSRIMWGQNHLLRLSKSFWMQLVRNDRDVLPQWSRCHLFSLWTMLELWPHNQQLHK